MNLINALQSLEFLETYETEQEKENAVNNLQNKAFLNFGYLLLYFIIVCLIAFLTKSLW